MVPKLSVPHVFAARHPADRSPRLDAHRAPRVGGLRSGHPRDGHVDPRHDDRQRRAAHPLARPAQSALPGPVGDHRLLACARGRHPGYGLGVKALWCKAGLHDLPGALHGRLRFVRLGQFDHLFGRVQGPAGRRRRHDHAGRDDDHGPGRRATAHGQGDGLRHDARHARPDPRTRRGRLDSREPALVLDLLRQRPDRDRRVRARLAHVAPHRLRRGGAPGRPGSGASPYRLRGLHLRHQRAGRRARPSARAR